jgi:hypothetical protein
MAHGLAFVHIQEGWERTLRRFAPAISKNGSRGPK